MALLRAIESKIEGIFEGVFGRAFRTNVQPIELARWLTKEMDMHRSVSVSRVYVPNEYTVYLAPSDRAQFASYEGSLIGELQEYLAEHARREGYALLTPPKVILATDPDLAMGESGVSARVVQPRGGLEPIAPPSPAAGPVADPVAPPPPPAATTAEPSLTMIYPREGGAPPAPAPEPAPAAALLTVEGREVPITGDRVVLGRSRECDIRLDDANVSRRHAEVRQEDDGFWVVDLGSTNGTEVNGKRIDRVRLSDGDRITLGSTDVGFSRPQS
jgi:FHA domain-containing protein